MTTGDAEARVARGGSEARLAGDGLRASAWSNGPFERYGAHRHDFDKVLVATDGSIVFRLPELDRALELAAGDRLDLPAGTLHAADVGPHGVGCLEAHLPQGALAGGLRHTVQWADADATPDLARVDRTGRPRTA